MQYVGIDFHKKYSFITEMDETGDIKRQIKLSNDQATLTNYLDTLATNTKIAIEATYNWYYFYELVEDHDLDISLAHPLKTKAIASARLMNDKVSSETLAHLLRADLLPTAYIPDQKTRDIREVLRMHASGGKVRMGSITKQDSKWLRWILVECASHADKKSPHYHALYTRVAHKHGNGTARVAVARSILRTIYAMLTFNRSYQERQLRSTPWGHNLKQGSET